ncbi:hypothetical protein BX666DRAFT_1442852 [Dichotomocladium elegans]|nr:hypothetical protein BX666DRAFT_1442852 [Dichotomocladium elegans]
MDKINDRHQQRPSASSSLSLTHSTKSTTPSTVEDQQLSPANNGSHCRSAPADADDVAPVSAAENSTDGTIRKSVNMSDIRRCRIPLRAFTLTEEMARTATVQEKVLSVLRKRQSISAAHWSQGSRLPMFKSALLTMERFLEEGSAGAGGSTADRIKPMTSVTEKRVVRRAKSVRLLSPKDDDAASTEKPTRRPLLRANSVPASQSSDLLLHKKSPSGENRKPTTAVAAGFTASTPSKRLPQTKALGSSKQQGGENRATAKAKQSIYRRKKVLPSESRTARLMMGVSTNGRQHQRTVSPSSAVTVNSAQQQKSVETTRRTVTAEASSTTRLHRFGYPGASSDAKKRPASFNGMGSKNSTNKKVTHPESNCLPKYSHKSPSKKGTSPVPDPAGTGSPDNSGKTNRNGGTSTFKGAKVVRVH